MADEENLEMGDDAAAAPKKSSKIGGFLPFLLKWIAIGLIAVVLIVTVSFVTVGQIMRSKAPTANLPYNEETKTERPVLAYYELDTIQTRTSDDIPAQVMVKVALGYPSEDKVTPTEITQRKVELIDFLRRYFTEQHSKDLGPQNEKVLQKEIKDKVNDEILSKSKVKAVLFKQFDVLKQ